MYSTNSRENFLWAAFVVVVAIGFSNLYYGLDYQKLNKDCKEEQCSLDCIQYDLERISHSFESRVIGQDLRSIIELMKGQQRGEPILINFYGPTGVGKLHAARILAENLYVWGLKSRFYFENPVQDPIIDCPRSLFVYKHLPPNRNWEESIVILITKEQTTDQRFSPIKFASLNLTQVERCLEINYKEQNKVLTELDKYSILKSVHLDSEGFVKNGCKSVIKQSDNRSVEL